MISPEITARPRGVLTTSLLASPMEPPTCCQDLGFPVLSNKLHSFLKLWFCFYILASTPSVCGSLSGCLVWLAAWNETVWTSEREGQRGRPSRGRATNSWAARSQVCWPQVADSRRLPCCSEGRRLAAPGRNARVCPQVWDTSGAPQKCVVGSRLTQWEPDQWNDNVSCYLDYYHSRP